MWVDRESVLAIVGEYSYYGHLIANLAVYTPKVAAQEREDWWIPANELLPKNDEYKIVTILDESGDTPYRYVTFGWYLEEANCWIVDNEKRTDVIAWAVLPLPYKKKNMELKENE